MNKNSEEIAKQIINNAYDEPILEEILNRFDELTNREKRDVIEYLIGALIQARESPPYSKIDR